MTPENNSLARPDVDSQKTSLSNPPGGNPEVENTDVSLSFIICTWNRPDLLELCLESFARALSPSCPWEILIVENNSDDRTWKVIRKYESISSVFRGVVNPNQNLSTARNTGCDSAKGSYIVYIDDDAKIEPEYICRLANCLATFHPDIMGGPVFPYYSTPKPGWFRDSYEIKKFVEVSGFYKDVRITGANFTIRREVLLKVGGFDPVRGLRPGHYIPGDERQVLEQYREITPPSDQKVYYSIECPVLHHVDPIKLNFRYFLLRHYASAKANAYIRRKLHRPIPDMEDIVYGIVQLPYRLIKDLLHAKRLSGKQADLPGITGRAAGLLGKNLYNLTIHRENMNNDRAFYMKIAKLSLNYLIGKKHISKSKSKK